MVCRHSWRILTHTLCQMVSALMPALPALFPGLSPASGLFSTTSPHLHSLLSLTLSFVCHMVAVCLWLCGWPPHQCHHVSAPSPTSSANSTITCLSTTLCLPASSWFVCPSAHSPITNTLLSSKVITNYFLADCVWVQQRHII